MSLLNPFILLGAVLAAVPVIIHFLNKTRYRVEPFGAMMFLRSAMKVRAQTLKLRQLLLLIMRAVLFGLLALALARPVQQPRDGIGGQQPTTHVIVVDGSSSMHQGDGADNAFYKARESALRIASEMNRGDNMQIIWAGRKPRALFPSPVFDKTYLKAEIERLEAGYEEMDMPRAFEQAFWALEQSALPRHRVYVLTDGCKNGWGSDRREGWGKITEHRKLLKIDPAIYTLERGPEKAVENVAVSKVYARSPIVDVFRQTTFVAEITNHSLRRRTLRVTFAVDGKLQAERALSLAPGAQTTMFDHLFEEAGSHYVEVSVPEDGLAVDDTLVHAVHVMHQIPILLIEGTSSENPWQADGALLKFALEATGRPGEEGLFTVSRRPQTDMDGLDTDYLNHFKTVVLANVTSLSEYFLFALERFVELGGGLLIACGDQPVPSEYNRMYKGGKGLLPAQLGDIVTYRTRFFQPTFPAGKASFILDAFDISRTRVLNDVNVEKYWTCHPAKSAILLATFDDDPFLVYKAYGQGRSILWTTAISRQWSNLPLTQNFLPLTQNLAVFLSASVQPPVNLAPGEDLLYSSQRPITGETVADAPTGESGGPAGAPPGLLTLPGGEERTLALTVEGDEWLAQWQDTARPGLYSVKAPGLLPRHFAVKPERLESDLLRLSDDGLTRIEQDFPLKRNRSEAGLIAAIRAETGVREWWRTILWVAVLLLCAELYLSWRFSQ